MLIPDNYNAFERYEAEQNALLKGRQVCDHCGEVIAEDFTWHIDGEWLCDECARDAYIEETPIEEEEEWS